MSYFAYWVHQHSTELISTNSNSTASLSSNAVANDTQVLAHHTPNNTTASKAQSYKVYNDYGTWIGDASPIALNNLPKSVQAHINSSYAKEAVRQSSIVAKNGKTLYYLLDIESGEFVYQLKFSEAGKLLGVERQSISTDDTGRHSEDTNDNELNLADKAVKSAR